MRFPAAASVTSRLAIAVVTDPERAQLASGGPAAGVREEALRILLQTAADAGCGMVATRPEGDNERLLGQAWPFPTPFTVTARTVPLSQGLDRVEARARRSLERMGLPRGETLLVSNPADLAGAEGRALWDRLNALKDRGLFRKIGVCATVEDGPSLLARRFQPDVIQIPCNILDQRAAEDGVLDALATQDVEIHIASPFVNGLLFMAGDALPTEFLPYAAGLSRVRRRLAEARIDPMQAALAYTLNLPGVGAVVASVASAAEMRAMLAAAHAPQPDLDWGTLALPEAAELSRALHGTGVSPLDDLRRISNAA